MFIQLKSLVQSLSLWPAVRLHFFELNWTNMEIPLNSFRCDLNFTCSKLHQELTPLHIFLPQAQHVSIIALCIFCRTNSYYSLGLYQNDQGNFVWNNGDELTWTTWYQGYPTNQPLVYIHAAYGYSSWINSGYIDTFYSCETDANLLPGRSSCGLLQPFIMTSDIMQCSDSHCLF